MIEDTQVPAFEMKGRLRLDMLIFVHSLYLNDF